MDLASNPPACKHLLPVMASKKLTKGGAVEVTRLESAGEGGGALPEVVVVGVLDLVAT
jgi:hypothetical protein